MKSHTQYPKWWNLSLMTALLLAIAFTVGCSNRNLKAASTSAATAQTTFATPADAGQALQNASRSDDETALAQILGPQSKAFLFSGDPAEDKASLESFANKYDRMNRWVAMTDGSRVLYIGADNYPFPIPLAQDSSSKWYFNTAAGEEEALARRIGKNELLAIDACSSIANAEELYFRKSHDGNPSHQYTQKIISTPGKHDGLYWEAAESEAPSPLGRVEEFARGAIASATSGEPPVFDGYYFRVLTGPDGFTVIGSPVKYRDSGIMTFFLTREGIVYQKDLGENTTALAASINNVNPADGWTEAE